MPRVERYGQGMDASDVAPGDFILAHRHHFLAALISLAERRRFRGANAPYAHWSHAALIVDGDGWLVGIRGVAARAMAPRAGLPVVPRPAAAPG